MSAPAISIIEGDPIGPTDPEYVEMMRFESGLADQTAQAIAGPHDEPWLNYLDAVEPHVQPAVEQALTHPDIAPYIGGKVIRSRGRDLLAGGTSVAPRRRRGSGGVAPVASLSDNRRRSDGSPSSEPRYAGASSRALDVWRRGSDEQRGLIYDREGGGRV